MRYNFKEKRNVESNFINESLTRKKNDLFIIRYLLYFSLFDNNEEDGFTTD